MIRFRYGFLLDSIIIAVVVVVVSFWCRGFFFKYRLLLMSLGSGWFSLAFQVMRVLFFLRLFFFFFFFFFFWFWILISSTELRTGDDLPFVRFTFGWFGFWFGLVWFFQLCSAIGRFSLLPSFFFTEFFYDVNPFVFFCFVSGFAPSLIELFSFIRQLDRF